MALDIFRSPHNPLISPEDVRPSRPDYEVLSVFNAGVAQLDGEIILLLRVAERPATCSPDRILAPIYDTETGEMTVKEFDRGNPAYDFSDPRLVVTPTATYLTSISHLRVARSKDGINFVIESEPAMFPANEYEVYGIEDPRIACIDGTYYVNYSAVSNLGVSTYLASTQDFREFSRHGIIFHPDNKDVTIFPEKISGKYHALHRPSTSEFGQPEMWIAESPDLLAWGNHRRLMGVREDSWDSGRIGGGAVPFRVEQGWLEIYHGATKDHQYCLGAVLLDGHEPSRVLARSNEPILAPEADYELAGFFGNVVFTCGVILDDGKVKVYYGASDTCMAYAEVSLGSIMRSLEWI